MIFSFAGLHPDPIQKLIDRISREKKESKWNEEKRNRGTKKINGKTENAVGQTKLMAPCVCQRKSKQKVTRKAHGLSCYISLSVWPEPVIFVAIACSYCHLEKK